MNKDILLLVQKQINGEEITHEEYESIQSSLEGTGLLFDFSHKQICEKCKVKSEPETEIVSST